MRFENKKTIYINGRFLTQPITGTQRYALELLSHIDILLEEEKYAHLDLVCLVPREPFTRPKWKNIKIIPVGINKKNLWEQIDLAFFARGSLLFSPVNTGPIFHRRQIVTIHDASVFAVPAAYSLGFRLKYRFIINLVGKSALLALTVSQFSRRELAKYLKVPVDRFYVISHGGDHLDDVVSDRQVLVRNKIEKNSYFLTVSSNSPHKNFSSVIRAAQKDRIKGVQFIAVGGTFSRIFQAAKSVNMPENVQLLGYVNDCELKALYENAVGLIFPSLYEGFGLPVLEAMQAGCPVLCANSAALMEVGGDAALYFDPLNPDDLASLIDRFLADRTLQQKIVARGLEQSAKFRWEVTARNTLDKIIGLLQ
jgi:glycosyltransferase involved in cell wall biosynthesis